MKTWKKIVIAAMALLVLLVVAAVIAAIRMIEPAAQRVLTEVVSPAVGAKVEAQSIDVSLLGGSCTVRGLTVADPQNPSAKLLRLDTVAVSLSLFSIFSNTFHIKDIRIEGGEATVKLGAGGGGDLKTLLEKGAGGTPAGAVAGVKGTSAPSAQDILSAAKAAKKQTDSLPSSVTDRLKSGAGKNDGPGSSADRAGESADNAGASADNAGAGADDAGGPNLVRIDRFSLTGCRLLIRSDVAALPPADVPLKEVLVTDIGVNGGVAPQQALQQIFSAVTAALMQTVLEKSGDLVKQRAAGAAESVLKQPPTNAGEVMKGLLGR